MNIASELLIIVALVLINGVLAGAEIALISLRKTRVAELVDEDRPGAKDALRLRRDPERFLATVQIGITVVGATASAFGGRGLARTLEPALAGLPFIGPYASQAAFVIVVFTVSYLSLVLGELVPKSLALRSAERYALLIAKPLSFLARLARPLVWFLTGSSNVVLRMFGDRTNFIETRLSQDELTQLVDEAAKSGSLHPQAGEIAVRAIDFGEVPAADVMIPRTNVVAIPNNITPEDLRRVLLEQAHSRYPVYEGSLDHVVGILSTADVLALAWERELIVLTDLIRPPYFVPESMRAVDVLREFQKRRLHFAIVVDERGGTAGIVTLNDLLSELVGEIFEEDDTPNSHVHDLGDGTYVVDANTPIRDANRELPFELPEGDLWSTVGGLCVVLAGHIPEIGEVLATKEGLPIEVLDSSPRRVHRVRVGPTTQTAAEE